MRFSAPRKAGGPSTSLPAPAVAMHRQNRPTLAAAALLLLFSVIVGPASASTLPTATTTTDEDLRPRDVLFEGKPVPTVDWMSNDIYNFTWGLTGVDNFKTNKFCADLYTTLAVLLGCLFLYRLLVAHMHHIRTVSLLASSAASNYFAQPLQGYLFFIQKHILLAPLFKKRHNEPFTTRYFHLHFGTLPSRISFSLVVGYFVSNLLYCTLLLPWNGRIGPDGKLAAPTKASLVAEFRGRCGVMATVNLVPLFLCILRNNYAGRAVGVGFNTWNLFHRWIGRVVFLEAMAHMLAWTVNKVDQAGWAGVWEIYGLNVKESHFLQTGLMSEMALIVIVVTSLAPIRHNHYQVFLGFHQLSVIFFLAGVWAHLRIDSLPQMPYVNATITLWSLERAHRIWTIYLKNIIMSRKGLTINNAEVEICPAGEEAVRVSVAMPKGWKYEPGTHAYLYIPRLSWTQSHPFSIAWSSESYPDEGSLPTAAATPASPTTADAEKNNGLPLAHRELQTSKAVTTIHFIIQRRNGFTNRLYANTAAAAAVAKDPERYGPYSIPEPKRYLALVEGPYHNEMYSFDSFSSVLFVAGAVGITHPLGYVRHLLAASQNNTVAARRVKLVWVVRERRNVLWISDWLSELWRLDDGRDMFELDIYYTRPDRTDTLRDAFPESKRVHWVAGRPNLRVLVAAMMRERDQKNYAPRGAVAVNVCGGGALSDSVRDAVRHNLSLGRIEFSEECFTWS